MHDERCGKEYEEVFLFDLYDGRDLTTIPTSLQKSINFCLPRKRVNIFFLNSCKFP